MTSKKNVNTPKNKYQSTIKYEQNNPTFSIRIPRELFNELNTYLEKTGRSRATFIKIAFDKLKANHTEAYKQGFREGYQQGFTKGNKEGNSLGFNKGYNQGYYAAKEKYGIFVNCCTCKTQFYIYPNSKEHYKLQEEIRRYLFPSGFEYPGALLR